MCLIYISMMENKKQLHMDLQSTPDMHIKYAWLNKVYCFISSNWKKGPSQLCNRLSLTRTTALHNRNLLFFSLSVLCTRLWTQGGLERLIYNVNHAVKGKANRKEHAQHQRRTLSCSHIFLSSAPCICPVTTAVHPPPTRVQWHWAITIHHCRHAERILH